MKKLNKKDLIYLSLTIIVFLIIIVTIYNKYYQYTELTLFNKEISIIETLRSLYYSNFDLFPDFLFNIGNGQNIYHLSEYGFLSPITLVSYLIPFLSIKNYLTIIALLSPIISTILLYRFFHNKKYPSEICFIISLIYITSNIIINTIYTSPLLSNYLIFLILSLYGVDKVYDEKKGYLLTISIFLMIMTNYYQSISGIICILIYSLYRYLKLMNTITIRTILTKIISIIIPIIVALLCSSILIIPSITTLSNNSIFNLTSNISINNLLTTGIGLSIIVFLIPSIINYIKKDKTNITLSIILMTLLVINILTNYSLISYIPLYLIIIVEFLNNILKKKINIKLITIISLPIIVLLILLTPNKLITTIIVSLLIITIYIYYKYSKLNKLIIIVLLIMCINPTLINKTNIINYNNSNIIELLNNIKDQNIYRTYIEEYNYNKLNYYTSTSIIENTNYLYQNFNQEILPNDNIISLLLNNNKYIISENTSLQGYQEIRNIGNLKLYKNNNVFPIGFASSNIMSYEDFSKLNKYTKQEALLNVIVADTESNNNFVPTIKKAKIELQEIFNHQDIITKKSSVFINAQEKITIKYNLPKKYQNKTLYIRFNVKNSRNNQIIKINNQTKTISKSSHTLEYNLSSSDQSYLVFTFTEGQYYIDDFEIYSLDYANIENCSKKISPLIIEPNNTKGDKIIGTIDVLQNGYFMITIPYEEGFQILVDNQQVKYEKVDETYIGFPIKEGLHSIEIKYTVPLKYLTYLLSTLGIISFVVITYFESKRKFN